MNATKIILIVGIVIALVVGAVVLMSKFPQTKPYADQATNLFNQGKDYVTTHLKEVGVYFGSLLALGGGALKTIGTIKQKATDSVSQATALKDQAASQLKTVQDERDQAIAKLQGIEPELSELRQRAAESELNSDEATKLATQQASEIERLRLSLNELMAKKPEVIIQKVPV